MVKATVPDPFWMTPAKLVLVFNPPVVKVPVVDAAKLVTVPPEPETSESEPMVSLKPCKSRIPPEFTDTADFKPNAPEVGVAPPTVAIPA